MVYMICDVGQAVFVEADPEFSKGVHFKGRPCFTGDVQVEFISQNEDQEEG